PLSLTADSHERIWQKSIASSQLTFSTGKSSVFRPATLSLLSPRDLVEPGEECRRVDQFSDLPEGHEPNVLEGMIRPIHAAERLPETVVHPGAVPLDQFREGGHVPGLAAQDQDLPIESILRLAPTDPGPCRAAERPRPGDVAPESACHRKCSKRKSRINRNR